VCDQLWRTHIEGQARVKAEQGSSTKTGEKQAALRRELHAQIAAQAPVHSSPGRLVLAHLFLKTQGFEKNRMRQKLRASVRFVFHQIVLRASSPNH